MCIAGVTCVCIHYKYTVLGILQPIQKLINKNLFIFYHLLMH